MMQIRTQLPIVDTELRIETMTFKKGRIPTIEQKTSQGPKICILC